MGESFMGSFVNLTNSLVIILVLPAVKAATFLCLRRDTRQKILHCMYLDSFEFQEWELNLILLPTV